MEIRLERGFSEEDGHVDVVRERWEQTLSCVLTVINGVTNDVLV